VFVGCDIWGRIVAQYAEALHLRVPEDLALVGADNDTLECELIQPPLSSVAIPWRVMGDLVADLTEQALSGRSIAGQRVVVQPVNVVARRSTESLAISDRVVRTAVAWIHAHADRRITVPAVAAAVRTPRQRLERLFRAHLGRTIMHEVRRTHVEVAKRLLATTHLPLATIADRSGFTTSALLNQAFHREVGLPPGEYRRRVRAAVDDGD
jgi:LacI family transcriptional regulator